MNGGAFFCASVCDVGRLWLLRVIWGYIRVIYGLGGLGNRRESNGQEMAN